MSGIRTTTRGLSRIFRAFSADRCRSSRRNCQEMWRIRISGRSGWKKPAVAAVEHQRLAAFYDAVHNLFSAQTAGKPDAKKIIEAEKAVANTYRELTEPLHGSFKHRSTNDYPETTTGRRTAFA